MAWTLAAFATSECRRILHSRPSIPTAEAAKAAARRAPALLAVAAGLHTIALSHESEESVRRAIPLEVRDAATARTVPSEDAGLIARLTAWLKRSPYELKKAKSPEAAFAVATPIASIRAAEQDTALVAACMEAFKSRPARASRAAQYRYPDAVLEARGLMESAARSVMAGLIFSCRRVGAEDSRILQMSARAAAPQRAAGAGGGDEADGRGPLLVEQALAAAIDVAVAAEAAAAQRAEDEEREWREWMATRARINRSRRLHRRAIPADLLETYEQHERVRVGEWADTDVRVAAPARHVRASNRAGLSRAIRRGRLTSSHARRVQLAWARRASERREAVFRLQSRDEKMEDRLAVGSW